MSFFKGAVKKIIVGFVVLVAVTAIAVLLKIQDESPRPAFANEEQQKIDPKTLGTPEAPVVLKEFSSLTCGHCSVFHEKTFKEIKDKYIDTGKVYYIYTDFPLNKPALDASLVSHCMTDERFWSFLDFLFSQQKEWAFKSKDHVKALEQNAKLAGLSEEEIKSCLGNDGKAKSLIGRMQKASKKYDINATPAFVIEAHGKQEKIIGNRPFQAFETIFEKFLKQAENGSKP